MDKKEKIVVVGFGWVGQANAIALSKIGYPVWFFDVSEEVKFHYRIDSEDLYANIKRAKTLDSVDGPNTWFIVCVGDRVSEEREQDISLIKGATDMLRDKKGSVILRSTVLPQKLCELYFDVYVPEFLHEKNAVEECIDPYYFVVGYDTALELPSFMKEWERRSYKVFKGTPEEASYIKYLSNIWNTIRIAFVNEMGDSIATPRTQDDVKKIERILDFVLERKSYLRYGQGFDGHCLPKDTRAYIGAHLKEGKNMDLLIGAYTSNEHHKMLQNMHQTLPKVFSFWDYDVRVKGVFEHIWKTVNNLALVKVIRKSMRGIMDGISSFIPSRSVKDTKRIWEKKARQNALYFSNPRTKSGELVTDNELNQTGASDYERYVSRDGILERLLKQNPDTVVLDFGCGSGRLTQYFAKDAKFVHGIDISDTMIESASQRLSSLKNVTFNSFDGISLPYEDEVFDIIFSYQTLQHVPTYADIERYFKSFRRLLKKSGVVKIQLRGGRGVKKWEWSHGVNFTPQQAISIAEKTGFTVADHQVEDIKNIWLVLKVKE